MFVTNKKEERPLYGIVPLFLLNPHTALRLPFSVALSSVMAKSIFSILQNKPILNVQLCRRICSVCADGTVQLVATKVFNQGARFNFNLYMKYRSILYEPADVPPMAPMVPIIFACTCIVICITYIIISKLIDKTGAKN